MGAGIETRKSLDGRFGTDDVSVKSIIGWGEQNRLRRVQNIVIRNLTMDTNAIVPTPVVRASTTTPPTVAPSAATLLPSFVVPAIATTPPVLVLLAYAKPFPDISRIEVFFSQNFKRW